MKMLKKIIFEMLTLFHRRHVSGKGILRFHPHLTQFIFGSGSRIILNGEFHIGSNAYGNNGRSNIIRIDENAALVTEGDFQFMYGADVILFPKSTLILGSNSFINSDCKIRCHKNIHIGRDCKISHDFTVMDSDVHCLEGDNHTDEVTIGDHVWIGTRVTILSGTKIGDGSVVAAGAIVRGEFPSHSLIAGVPAKVVRSGIEWSE